MLTGIALMPAGCRSDAQGPVVQEGSGAAGVAELAAMTTEQWIEPELPVAYGFDFPVGNRDGQGSYTDRATGREHQGWYVAAGFCEQYQLGIHPGEDWNGRGGGNTDLGQPLYAIGAGRVVHARHESGPWGGVVLIEHWFYENHQLRRIHSLSAHLSRIDVEAGQEVTRRQLIGAIGQDPGRSYPAHLHLEIRRDLTLAPTYWPSSHDRDEAWVREHYLPPTAFIEAHRELPNPWHEEALLLIEQDRNRLWFFQRGELLGEYEVAFGQARGRKRETGDLCTPKGMYFVSQKNRITDTGGINPYYGGYWIKINYPNPYDAAYGLARGWISKRQAATIGKRWQARKLTLEDTRLGGGIGLHGWVREWRAERDGTNLSWGCVVLHQRDIGTLYQRVPVGAMVVIR
jgi:murein DD-endopeptidase MepM/ murein hydrolase activator NlpD